MELEPKTKKEAMERLIAMPNRETRRKQFKAWRKQFDLSWDEVSIQTKK